MRRYPQQVRLQVHQNNQSYTQYEEELRQFMIEYEIAVGTEGVPAEDALTDYENKLRSAFEVHRSTSADNKDAAIAKLIEIVDKYVEIGTAFRKDEENPAESAAESDTSEQTEEAAAESDIAPAESSDAEETTENHKEEA